MPDDLPEEDSVALAFTNCDWHLQSLVALVNKNLITFDITFTIGGLFISGTLIGGKEYFTLFADSFVNAWPNDDSGGIRESFAGRGAIYEKDVSSADIHYVHLRNARTLMNGTFYPTDGCLWRGKISAIDGFSLGALRNG